MTPKKTPKSHQMVTNLYCPVAPKPFSIPKIGCLQGGLVLRAPAGANQQNDAISLAAYTHICEEFCISNVMFYALILNTDDTLKI